MGDISEIQDDYIAAHNKQLANLTRRESATMGKKRKDKVGYKSFISSSKAGESSVNVSLI